jgi:hypothetical protein
VLGIFAPLRKTMPRNFYHIREKRAGQTNFSSENVKEEQLEDLSTAGIKHSNGYWTNTG